MRLHYFEHVPYEGPGCIEDWTRENDHVLTRTQWYRQPEPPDPDDIDGLIIMGGPMSVNDQEEHPWLKDEIHYLRQVIDGSLPVLGICLGAQLVARALGARVKPLLDHEIGWFEIKRTDAARDHPLTANWPDAETVFHWHGETFEMPEGATHLARSKACRNQAFVYRDRVVGLQYHLEMRPEDIQRLIEWDGDEDRSGPYVQDREEILAAERQSRRLLPRMNRLLDRLFNGQP